MGDEKSSFALSSIYSSQERIERVFTRSSTSLSTAGFPSAVSHFCAGGD
jgi:hypothetical protein